MAFKQPRVPEYRESDGTGKYIRSLVLFLKDFCMDVWTANNQRTVEISDAVKGYPVTSVCGKTGDVTLTAEDVGALPSGGTAADSSKLGGKTLAEIMLTLYPVGTVYISAVSTSPASLFGGTWESIGGRFLLGADSTFTAGSTGGEATHTLTVNEMPKHNHASGRGYVNVANGSDKQALANQYLSGDDYSGNSTSYKGGGEAHNNMPPYLAVYMWKRVS